jgi:phospholipid/cholesterol/gamma-HCH transport system ATP-binding protein
VLFDEPDSGLDPVRTAYLNQLIVDLNQQTGATFLIVTHDVNTARTVPDNIGLLYHRHLAMFGPREMCLCSQEPVVRQFLNARKVGPIGMSEEKDISELEAEAAMGHDPGRLPPIPPQLMTGDGRLRPTQRPPGEWLRRNNIPAPPGSFVDDTGRNWVEEWPRYVAAMAPAGAGHPGHGAPVVDPRAQTPPGGAYPQYPGGQAPGGAQPPGGQY